MGCKYLKNFAGSPKNPYFDHVSVPAFRQNLAASTMLCRPSSQLFVKYSSTFGDSAQRFGYLFVDTKMMDVITVFFVCFIQAAECGAANLFMPARR